MRVLLIYPDTDPLSVIPSGLINIEPLGLEYLAAELYDHDVTILDMKIERHWQRFIEEVQPDLVGITGTVIHTQRMIEVLDHVKRIFPEAITVVGGTHATLVPGDFEQYSVDVIIRGQGTSTFRHLVDATAPLAPSGSINPGHVRLIRAPVYNGLPVELRMLIGGPLEDVTEDVPVPTDGQATILNLAGYVPWEPETFVQDFACIYDQAIPKPFCSDGPYDIVYVSGSVSLLQTTTLTSGGKLERTFRAQGTLSVVPIDPFTGQPTGAPMRAEVLEQHDAWITGAHSRVSSLIHQVILPPSADGAGKLIVQLRVNSRGADGYRRLEQCGDNEPLVGLESGGTVIGRYAR